MVAHEMEPPIVRQTLESTLWPRSCFVVRRQEAGRVPVPLPAEVAFAEVEVLRLQSEFQ